jgi:autotransporter-associated beta strand protein
MKNPHEGGRTFVLCVLSLLPGFQATAQTNVFTAAEGSFHDPAAWSPPLVPGIGETAAVTSPAVIAVSQDIGSALALSAAATLMPAAPGLAITGGVTAPDGIPPPLAWSGTLASTNILLFPGATLAGVTGASGTLGGTLVPTFAHAFFFTNDGASASFQLQTFQPGNKLDKYIKSVKVALEQQPNGIHGRAVYARYIFTLADLTGAVDFDTEGTDNGTAYFATGLTLFSGPELTAAVPPPLSLFHNAYITGTDALLFPGATLANYRSATALMAGGAFDDDNSDAHVFHFQNDGAAASFQLQRRDNGQHTKCLKIELTQQADGIHGRAVYAKYRLAADGYQLGFDFDTGGSSSGIATSLTAGGYGCPCFALHAAPAASVYLPAADAVLAAPGASFDQLAGLSALLGGARLNNRDPVPALPFHWTRLSPTNATVQFQAFYSNATLCVKAEIIEAPDGLRARSLYAKTLELPDSAYKDRRGIDFDLAGEEAPLASSPGTAGGIGIVRLSPGLAPGGFSARAPIALPGRLTLNAASLSPTLAHAPHVELRNGAALLLDTPGVVTLAAPVRGAGTLLVAAPPATASPALTNPVHAAFIPAAPDAATVLSGAALADISGAVAVMNGASVSGGPVPAQCFHWRAESGGVTFQVQILNDIYTKCVKVLLSRQGDGIAASVLYARYLSQFRLGFDFDTSGWTPHPIATASGMAGYGVSSLALVTGGASPLPATLAAGFSVSGPVAVEGRAVRIAAPVPSLPPPASVQVRGGGHLIALANRGIDGNGLGDACPLSVSGGSTFEMAEIFTLGMHRPVTFTASECRLSHLNAGDSGQYAANVTLQNGARLTGNKIRVGNSSSSPYWLILGPAASTNAAGFTFVKKDTLPFVLDCRGDLAVTGQIRDYPEAIYFGQPFIKTGPGLLSMAAPSNTFQGPVTVRAGVLRIEASDALVCTNALAVLPGATLALAAADPLPAAALALDGATVRAETPAALNLAGETSFAGAVTLDFGTNALTVGAASFAPDATVALAGDLSAETLCFLERLTPGQLAAFAAPSGRSVWQNAAGYLRDTPRGLLFTVQ